MKKLIKIALRTAVIVTTETAICLSKLAVEATNGASKKVNVRLFAYLNKTLEQPLFPRNKQEFEELEEVGSAFNEVIYGEMRKLAQGCTNFTAAKDEIVEAYAAVSAISVDMMVGRISANHVTLN